MLTLFLIWSNLSLQTEEFAFSSARLPAAFDGFRIVQLSDLHGAQFGRDNARLAAAVEEADPDIVVLTGDMIDERSTIDDLLPLIDALTAQWGVYYVTGNHEWAAHDVPELIKEMESRGVACLENEYADIFKKLIEREKALEVNTSGVKFGEFTNPDRDLLGLFKELGGKYVTTGSDSHDKNIVGSGIEVAENMIRELGFAGVTVYVARQPRIIPFK